MITSPARGADRVVGVSGPPPRALAASTTLVVLLLVALALRLTIAYILFPASGFETDITTYVSWALTMAREGPGGFYANAGFIDYPPGYLLVLWPIGLVAQAFGGGDPGAIATPLVKLPAMLADIGVGWLLYRLVLGWAWPSRRAEGLALGAAALYVLNPVTWYDSALWGQTDSIGSLVLLMGVAALVRGNSEGAAFLGVLAALVKPQFGVVLIPIVAVVLLRRHLLRPGSGPRHVPWAPERLRGWLAREQGPLRIVTSGVVALVAFHVLALPFGMGIPQYLELMGRTASGYEYLTVNAFNPWALVGLDGDTALAWAMPYWQSDLVPLVAGVSAFAVGALLLVGGFLYGLANLLFRDERRTIIVAAIFLALTFFVLPTRVHERYLMPVFALVPLLAVTSRSWLLALVGLAVASLINLHAVLTYDLWGTDNVIGLPLAEATRTPTFVVASVLLVTGGFLFAAWRLWRGAARQQDDLARLSSEVEGTVVGPHAMPGTARAVADGTPGVPFVDPRGRSAWDEPVRGPSALDWIIDRVTPRPLRADRSATLVGEPPGRLDRLDLLMVLLVFLSAMTLRGFRIAEPYDMYFDEVYHARTAMEFLQDWRYDDPHDIYEWTHPHLAKYAMAIGIELLGDHRVTGDSALGVPVRSAALERRWSEDAQDAERRGDRLYVATGDDVRVYDLETRVPVATIPVAATALGLDADDHRLYLAGPSGTLATLDTTLLDALPGGGASPLDLAPVELAACCAFDPAHITVTDSAIVVLGTDGSLASFDPATGEALGTASVPGAVGIEGVPGAALVMARPGAVSDPASAAEVLAEDLATDPAVIEERLRSTAEEVVLAGWVDDDALASIQGHIDGGSLPGVTLSDGSVPVVAVTDPQGVSFRASTTLDEIERIDLESGASGMEWVQNGPDDPSLYVAAGTQVVRIEVGDNGPDESGTIAMPGPVSDVLFNDVADLLHVQGDRNGTPTIYVVDLHGDPGSVFMDVPLPYTPAATVIDTQPDRPSVDRTQILAFANDGRVASVDVGGNAFGYRMPGVLMGALTVVGIYLLARLLFRRRSVGLFAAALALCEGMLFVNPRIAMNDAYVTGFLVLAAALFVPVWLGAWRRWWQVALVVPLVGVLLGLALASKWVGAYAIGGFVLLLLLRSSLGRVIALFGMLGLTATLGALAIRPADVEEPHRNWPFLLIMVLLTLALAAAMVRRPIRLTRGEVVSAVVWLVIGGVLCIAAGVMAGPPPTEDALLSGPRLLVVGGAAVLAASLVGLGAILAGRLGHGPWAPRAEDAAPVAPASPGWLSPGRLVGLPWLLALGCLVVIPVVVYVISYAPWVALDNRFWSGFPADNGGQTLWDLTLQMYRYHDDLRVPHAASSPWWAWPLNLKPVWYYQDAFAGSTTGEIYDAGNLVIFWMGLPALLFAAVAAWRRRSLALTVVVLLFLVMWIPWARIDRATFQYHYYTAVPFLVLALAYLAAELWHGPARLAWLLARVGAALCILGPSLMWLLRPVLCTAANTASTEAGRQVCGASVRDVMLSQRSVVIIAILVVAGIALTFALWRAYRAGPPGHGLTARLGSPMVLVGVVVVAAVLALAAAVVLTSDAERFTFQLTADELGAISFLVLLAPAWVVLRARDARRFALGLLVASALFLLIWYPNLSGLPLPNGLATAFQGLLPTWTYDFQFAVNRDPPVPGGIVDLTSLVVALVTGLGVVIVMVAARFWHRRPEPLFLDEPA